MGLEGKWEGGKWMRKYRGGERLGVILWDGVREGRMVRKTGRDGKKK